MKATMKKLACILLATLMVAVSIPNESVTAKSKQNTFKKDGLVYAVISEDDNGSGEVSVISVNDKADKELLSTLIIPGEVKKNKKTYTVKKIESLAFSCRSGINLVVIDEGVEEIGDAAFYKCYDLSEVHIFRSVKKIGKHCFGGCSNLGSIVVNSENENFVSENGILYSKDKKILISAPGVAGDITVNKSVEVIGGGAFDSNIVISSVSLPSGVKKIEEGAFFGCTALKSVKLGKIETIGREAFAGSGLVSIIIPESVSYIEGNPFMFCSDLTDIEVKKNNKKYKTSKGFLMNESGKKLISGSAAKNGDDIPSSVKTIGEFAFAGNNRLKKIVVPSGVKKINEGAFSYCTSLKKVRFLSRNTELILRSDESYGVFFNTDYDLIVEVPYSEDGFKDGSIEKSIEENSPAGVDITTF